MIEIPQGWKILIPCYNGGSAAQQFLSTLAQKVPLNSVLLVNDGSEQHFSDFLKSLPFPCLDLPENQGKGGALLAGLKELQKENCNWALTIDCDGQHPVESLRDFFAKAKEGDFGILLGKRRFKVGEMPPARIFSNRVSSQLVAWVAGAQVLDAQCGYRGYNLQRIPLEKLPRPSRFQWESEVLINCIRMGMAVGHVEIPAIYGEEISNISHVKDTWRFLKMLFRKWREK